MKTLLKISAVLVIIFIALLFILPVVYKSEIIRLTKNELNKNVNATIDFEDIDLSLITSFPDFNLSVYGLNIVGTDEFHLDTLVKIETISMAINIFSVFNSDNYEVKKIKLIDPVFNIRVLENGKANYDISLPSEDNTNTTSTSEDNSAFQLAIKKFQISNGELTYNDIELNTYVHLSGLNHTLSGKLATDNVLLFTKTKIANLNITYDGIPYLSNVAVVYQANINADIKNEIYTLGKNELILNNLLISFDGSVSYVEDDLNLVLTFNSQGNKFKDILSLVPAIYSNDFKGIKTDGTFSVNGFVKGTYNDENLPSFNVSATVEDGMFKYPDLPKSVKNINIKSSITSKGGIADNTIIDVSEFSLQLGDNPFHASLKISTPVSDPDIKAKITGEFDLNSIKDYYPIDDNDELIGNLIFDILLEGQMSSIENEKYDKFVAMGSVLARDINYSTSSLREPVKITVAQLNFSPHYLDLVNFKLTTGISDLQATGKIENYLAYYFNTGSLKGTLISKSNYMNIDELLVVTENENIPLDPDQSGDSQQPETGSLSIIEIPENINFTISAQFNKLIYDSLEMDNVKGGLVIANKTLQINNLRMDAVEGKMIVNGSYSTADVTKPEVDFNMKMVNLSIPNAYNQFAIFRNYIPLAKKTTGLFSADFKINTILDKKMMPVYSTMNGGGTLSTSKIIINDLNSLTQIAEALNLIKFKKLELDELLVHFQFVNGKMEVKPTKFNYQNIEGEIEGWTGFDQSIGYDLNIKVPREEFGSDANKVLDGLLATANSYGANFSMPNIIPINIYIGGTLSDPIIKTKLHKTNSTTVIEEASEKIKEEIEKKKDELGKEAAEKAQKIIDDADKQAKYLIKEAEKQAKIIRDNASEAKKTLIAETDKQAEALIAEGKKNGFVAEMAAKEAAKQLRNEVANNGDNIIKEADKKADELIQEAKKASNKLKEEADKEAKKVLKK